LALKYHPDKNPGDEEAKAKFQRLLKVYQTLSNPQRRADYDRYGEHEDEDRGEEQAEEADADVEGIPQYWTVEELETLLSELGETKDLSQNEISMMQKNMEFERTMDPAYVWTEKIVSKEIERAHAMGVNEICFMKKELKKLPPSIGKLTNLIVLQLTNNKLTSLPPTFTSLQNLQILRLDSNLFEVFPSQLCALTNLTELNLQHNKLKALPTEISQMISLRELNLFSNQLEDGGLPDTLFDIKSLTKLDLECNFIITLPQAAAGKRNLTILIDPTVNIGQESHTRRGAKKKGGAKPKAKIQKREEIHYKETEDEDIVIDLSKDIDEELSKNFAKRSKENEIVKYTRTRDDEEEGENEKDDYRESEETIKKETTEGGKQTTSLSQKTKTRQNSAKKKRKSNEKSDTTESDEKNTKSKKQRTSKRTK
jgi:hypothetical protein